MLFNSLDFLSSDGIGLFSAAGSEIAQPVSVVCELLLLHEPESPLCDSDRGRCGAVRRFDLPAYPPPQVPDPGLAVRQAFIVTRAAPAAPRPDHRPMPDPVHAVGSMPGPLLSVRELLFF